MKPFAHIVNGILFYLLLIVLAAFAWFATRNEKPINQKHKLDSLHTIILYHQAKINRYKDTLSLKDQHIKVEYTKRLQAEVELAQLKQRLATVKVVKPITRKDTIIYLQAVNVACDSVVDQQDHVIGSLKDELKAHGQKEIILDSMVFQYDQEVARLTQVDSLHNQNEKELRKSIRKKQIKAGVVGGIIVLILSLL